MGSLAAVPDWDKACLRNPDQTCWFFALLLWQHLMNRPEAWHFKMSDLNDVPVAGTQYYATGRFARVEGFDSALAAHLNLAETKSDRQKIAQVCFHDRCWLRQIDEQNRQLLIEFRQHLPAGSARHRASLGCNRNHFEPLLPRGHCRKHRRPLRTNRQPI